MLRECRRTQSVKRIAFFPSICQTAHGGGGARAFRRTPPVRGPWMAWRPAKPETGRGARKRERSGRHRGHSRRRGGREGKLLDGGEIESWGDRHSRPAHWPFIDSCFGLRLSFILRVLIGC